MRDAVLILEVKTKRQKKWAPLDVFAGVQGASAAKRNREEKYPKLMFRVRRFVVAGRG